MGDIKITYPLFSLPSSPCYRAHVETDAPYALVETLRIIAARGMFKGKCPVCEDW